MWLENLIGSDIHNASSIHPGWQHRAVGDRVVLANPALHGRLGSDTEIVALEPGRMIANIPRRLVLRPLDDGGTRVLYRETDESQGPTAWRVAIWDPMHFSSGWSRVLVYSGGARVAQAMLAMGIVYATGDPDAALAFLAIGVTTLGALEIGRHWWPMYVLIAAAVLFTLLLTPDAHAALGVAFLEIVGVTAWRRNQSLRARRTSR